MSEWKEYKLEDVCLKITDGSHFSPKVDPNGKRIIGTVKDMLDYSFDVENCKKINEEEYDKLLKNDCKPKQNDILFSKDGTIGKVIVFDFDLDIVILSSIAIIRPNTELINPRFLAYILKSKKSQEEINENYKSGSAIPRVILRDFKRFPISIPDLSTQTSIAEILSSLDDKIELNNKINEELETLAQTLFKQWFIDFEFPNENGEPYKSSVGEMVDSELGEIPKGWEVYKFKELVDKYIDNRGKTPPIEKEGIPLVEVKHMVDIGIYPSLNTDKFISQEVYDTFLRAYLQEDDILMSTVGTIGRLNIVPDFQLFAIAQNVLGIRFRKELVSQLFMFCLMRTKGFNDEIKSRLIETVQSSIKRGDLEKIPVLIPNSILIENFENIIRDLFNLIKSTTSETIELIKLRDTLLPKIISGEIEIKENNN